MTKISVSLLAKILGYAFAGYGLVCDAHFLKALFQQGKLGLSRFSIVLHSFHQDEAGMLPQL